MVFGLCDICFEEEEAADSGAAVSSDKESLLSLNSHNSYTSKASDSGRGVISSISSAELYSGEKNQGVGGVFAVHDEVRAKNYSFADVWHAIRTEKNFKFAFWFEVSLNIIFETFNISMGNCMICIALSIIGFVSYVGFFFIIPVVEPETWSPSFIATVIFGIFKMYSILFHYIMAVKTDPGYITTSRESDLTRPTYDPTNRYPVLESRCKKCLCSKPLRAHHCSTCRKCVLKMDHHCPWIGNCVGLRNYRYFVSFLFWVTLTTVYVAYRSSGIAVPILGPIFADSFSFNTLFGHSVTSTTRRERKSVNISTAAFSSYQFDSKNNSSIKHPFFSIMMARKPNADTANVGGSGSGYLDNNANNGEKRPGVSGNNEVISEVQGKILEENENSVHDMFWFNRRRLNRDNSPGISSKIDKRIIDIDSAENINVVDASSDMSKVDKKRSDLLRINKQVGSFLRNLFTFNANALQFQLENKDDVVIVTCFCTCILVATLVGGLLCFHLYILLNGQTTLEYSELKSKRSKFVIDGVLLKRPFDRGIWVNLSIVFGKYPWYVSLLPFPYCPDRSVPAELHSYFLSLSIKSDDNFGDANTKTASIH